MRILTITFLVLTGIGILGTSDGRAETMRDYYVTGEQAYMEGRYEDAVSAFEKAIELDPNFAPVFNALGLVYRDMKAQTSDVVWFFKVAVDIDPDFIQAYDNMCKTYFQASEFDLAEKSCLKALALNPQYGSAEITLAWIYLAGKSRPADAVYYFQRVLEKIQNPMVYFGLGLAYSMQGDRARALEVITQLRQLGKDDLASQIESTMRGPVKEGSAGYVPTITAPVGREPSAGQIVSAHPEPEPAPADSGSGAGSTRIRLRGKLSSRGGAAPTPPAAEQKEKKSASSSSSSTLGQHTTGISAAERIRRLQQLQQGLGGGTNMPAGY